MCPLFGPKKGRLKVFTYLALVLHRKSYQPLIATYIDFIEMIGLLVIFSVAVYSIKKMLIKSEKRIDKVNVRIGGLA